MKVKCSRCKKIVAREMASQYAHSILSDGTRSNYYNCHPCNTARAKRYRSTAKGYKNVYASVSSYAKRNSEKVRAWRASRSLPKLPCEVCGAKRTHKHHDNYAKPLEIRHLCARCHVARHRMLKALTNKTPRH